MSTPGPAFTCPCCDAVSHHPADLEQGYCGRCHWWTADPALGPPHLAESCEARDGNPEFAAFVREFRDANLAASGVPPEQMDLWRDLR
jgi:hypothetical protein